MKRILSAILVGVLSLGLGHSAFADGTETLGTPSIAIANGSGIVAAGTGLQVQPGTFDLDVPGTVVQALAYWGGSVDGPLEADNTININGTDVTGTLIGGPAFFYFPAVTFSAHRADITSMVSSGLNSFTVSGMDNDEENNGMSIVVIYDDGVPADDLQLVDGLDLAFINFPGDRGVTVPQTFDFAAAAVDRSASLTTIAGSVQPDRPNLIEVTIDGITTQYWNLLASNDGADWDTIAIDVTIPAGAASLTVQLFSADDGSGLLPASLDWTGSALAIAGTPPEPELGEIGDTVFCDLNNNGVQDPEDPGVPGVGVILTCAGPDGVLGTADDITDYQLTDANGNYLFVDLPAGMCTAVLDETTIPAGKEVGQCPVEFMIDLAEGESFLDADFCIVDEPPVGFEGCTPGYWKQSHHFDSWMGYTPDTPIVDVFPSVAGYSQLAGDTLLDALNYGGGPRALGGAKILLRAAVAGLLNAASTDVDYARTEGEVLADVDAALATGSRGAMLDLASEIDIDNNAGCPLN